MILLQECKYFETNLLHYASDYLYSFQPVTEINHRSPEHHVSRGKKISDSETPDSEYAVSSANAIVEDSVRRHQGI